VNLTIHITDAHLFIFFALAIAGMYFYARVIERRRVFQYLQDNDLLTGQERVVIEKAYQKGLRI